MIISERYATCVHEAAHAVVGAVTYISPRTVGVAPSLGDWSLCGEPVSADFAGVCRGYEQPENHPIRLILSPLSEGRTNPDPYTEDRVQELRKQLEYFQQHHGTADEAA